MSKPEYTNLFSLSTSANDIIFNFYSFWYDRIDPLDDKEMRSNVERVISLSMTHNTALEMAKMITSSIGDIDNILTGHNHQNNLKARHSSTETTRTEARKETNES